MATLPEQVAHAKRSLEQRAFDRLIRDIDQEPKRMSAPVKALSASVHHYQEPHAPSDMRTGVDDAVSHDMVAIDVFGVSHYWSRDDASDAARVLCELALSACQMAYDLSREDERERAREHAACDEDPFVWGASE